MEDSVHGNSRRYRPWSGGVDRGSGCGIGIVNGGGEGWTLSRATHTLASALCVVLHLREIPVGEPWCESVDLSDLSFRLYASLPSAQVSFDLQQIPELVVSRFSSLGEGRSLPMHAGAMGLGSQGLGQSQ